MLNELSSIKRQNLSMWELIRWMQLVQAITLWACSRMQMQSPVLVTASLLAHYATGRFRGKYAWIRGFWRMQRKWCKPKLFRIASFTMNTTSFRLRTKCLTYPVTLSTMFAGYHWTPIPIRPTSDQTLLSLYFGITPGVLISTKSRLIKPQGIGPKWHLRNIHPIPVASADNQWAVRIWIISSHRRLLYVLRIHCHKHLCFSEWDVIH